MSIIIKRRELVAALGSAAAWSLGARAQQSWVPVVGFLNSASAEHWAPFVAAFRQGLSDAGYIEGQNVVVEYRWADDQYDRLPALAADLVRRHVNVIAANHVAAEATKSVVTTIPIVFTTEVDPVELGLVASLSRPGGNLTGITTLNEELVPKRMELLREVLPTARSIAIVLNPTNPGAHTVTKHVQAAARALGLDLHLLPASDDQQLEAAFRGVAGLPSGGVVIGPDPFLASRSERLAELALAHKLPAVFAFRQFVAAGGLMSYGGSLADVYRLSGIYVGRILKGEKPADLPVQQSTKVELLINLRTAKTLGLTIPLSLTGRADEVIE